MGFRKSVAIPVAVLSALSSAHAAPTRPEITGYPAVEMETLSLSHARRPLRQENAFQPAAIDQWSERVQTVFKALMPQYRLSFEPVCGSEAVPSISAQSPEVKLYFYAGASALPIVEIHLISHQTANAIARTDFALIDGTRQIIMTDKLLNHIASASELAFVLGHEFAHLELGHTAHDLPLALMTDSQLQRVSEVHKRWEFQADRRAFELMAQAGFATESAKGLLEKLSAEESTAHPAELHSHPTISARIEALEKHIQAYQTAWTIELD